MQNVRKYDNDIQNELVMFLRSSLRQNPHLVKSNYARIMDIATTQSAPLFNE